MCIMIFFFQAEDGIRDLVRSRGLGDVYKRQEPGTANSALPEGSVRQSGRTLLTVGRNFFSPRETTIERLQIADTMTWLKGCLLYTSDAADERSSVDLGGRRIIKKKKKDCMQVQGRAVTTERHVMAASQYDTETGE